MPTPLIRELAEKIDMPIGELEAIWQKAIQEANKKQIKNKYAYATAALEHVAKNKGMDSQSTRFVDANGALICPNSIITGADVANYYGMEIPNFETLGLNPNQIYRVYRPIEEMQDNDFNGKHLLSRHIGDFDSSTFQQYKDDIIGVAYDCVTQDNQIQGTIAFNDPKAIDDLMDGKKYLSAGYWYTPVLEKGTHEGMAYDIRMTNIRANHIAHVDNPRYKNAVVGDEDLTTKGVTIVKLKNKYPSLSKQFAKLGMDEDTVESALNGMDEEAVKKAEDEAKKVEDEAKKAEDEEAEKKKAEDEEKEKELKKAQDEIAKLKGEKGMDSDTIAKAIQKAVADEVGKFTTNFQSQTKAMDTAMAMYRERFGNPSIAFDSADAVYDSILKHEGVPYQGKTIDQKMAMVEVLGVRTNSNRNVNIGMDSAADDFSYLSDDDRKRLGV